MNYNKNMRYLLSAAKDAAFDRNNHTAHSHFRAIARQVFGSEAEMFLGMQSQIADLQDQIRRMRGDRE